jgi:signal transduction histidine kinase
MQALASTRLQSYSVWLARLAWAATFLLVVGMLVANAPFLYFDTTSDWQVNQAYVAALAFFPSYNAFIDYVMALKWITAGIYAGTAVLLAWRRPDDWMVLYASATLLMTMFLFGFGLDTEIIRYPRWLEQLFPPIRALVPTLIITSLVLLFFLFPDGRFMPRQGRWLVLATICVMLLFGLSASIPAIARLLGNSAWGWYAFFYMLLVTMLAGLAGQVARYRRLSTPEQRRQVRLVLFGLAAVLLIPLGDVVLALAPVGDESMRSFIALQLNFLCAWLLPITIAISVLRYRLWEMERLIGRALAYGALTAAILGLYVLVVGGLGALLHTPSNPWLTILVIGLIAVLFQPARQRLQQGVNRLMYGERDEPLTVLARLGERLEATTAPAGALPTIVETIAQALKLRYVAVTVRQDDAFQMVASVGQPTAAPPHRFPLIYQAEIIGELLAAPREPGESFGSAEQRLLENLARQTGSALHAGQLTDRLQRSRERLVVAREEERRRLRRDLHDGLGPQLASLSLKLDAARNQIRRDPDQAEVLLAEIKAQTQASIADIRRVVYDLRPPALDQFGLVSALCEYAASHNRSGELQIVVDTPAPLPSLPAAVEVAAYRIAQEAISNVIQHAQARYCTVRLSVREGLQVEVRDDGRGMPMVYTAGVGLASMRERAAELGGRCEVDPAPGAGTAVVAWLPLT